MNRESCLCLSFPQTEEQAEDASEPVKGSLNRAQSAQAISAAAVPAREDGLKRVSSEPVLCAQGKGALLKRKLSLLEQDVIINEDGRNKLKKQGGEAFILHYPREVMTQSGLGTSSPKSKTLSALFD